MKPFTKSVLPPFIHLPLALAAVAVGLALSALPGRAENQAEANFYLKPGDHVCFYGDSITEQRFYGVDVETFVRTRFPNLHVKFVNSGVGGDKVTGGWAGKIDLRLKRDVFPFKPNVVTIMLGMNDGKYRPFDQSIFDTYTNGYEYIIESLQKHLPGVRIVLIQPTPFDDITEAPQFPDGYNAVLLRYAAFVRQLAAEHHLQCVDFMTPLLDVMKKAQAENPKLAHEVIPRRVHPSAAGELVMAQALLKAWNAPATVTSVKIDTAKSSVARAENTVVEDFKDDNGKYAWTQRDECLPFPILALHNEWPQFPPMEDTKWGKPSFFWPAPAPRWDYTNPATAMIVKDCHFYDSLNQEPLQVSGLPAGSYQLTINGQPVGEFTAAQLDAGINLAEYRTPMLEQSYHVMHLVWQQVEWRFFAWRGIQTRLMEDHDPAVQTAADALVAALEAQKEDFVNEQYAAAKPRPTHYELTQVSH